VFACGRGDRFFAFSFSSAREVLLPAALPCDPLLIWNEEEGKIEEKKKMRENQKSLMVHH